MTVRVGPKGQIVIPKAIRDRASIEPGDEVDVELRNDTVVVTPRRSPRRLGGRFARTGMAERLLRDRRDEPR
jgi:AbrB family looped-hinge helix DNA binding protein